jgi:hypothetical protein
MKELSVWLGIARLISPFLALLGFAIILIQFSFL